MLKQIKCLGLSILLGASLLFTGCSNKNELTSTLTSMETEINTINDDIDTSDTFDKIAIENAIDEMEIIQDEIRTEQSQYEKTDIEYKMFDELNTYLDYKIELCEILVEMSDNMFETALLLDEYETKVNTYSEKMNKAWDNYEAYKKELEITTTPIESTATNKLEETKVEDNKSDVQPDEEKQIVCAHCEKTFKKSEIQRVGENDICNKCYEASLNGTTVEQEVAQCYDCGDHKPVSQMTYNGRSYHCGCLVGQCEACGTSIFKGQVNYSNGHLLCAPCYQQEQDEMQQYEKENNEILYGSDEDNWSCPDCGYTGPLGTLCDCE